MNSLPLQLVVALLLLLAPSPAFGNELTRCCAGGSRHLRENGNCQTLRATGSSPTCARTASICCLRALIDASCQAGLLYAQRHKLCSTVVLHELAGGVKRECCDCCLLAQELSQRGEQCLPPTGFSPDCLSSFNKCCNRTEKAAKSLLYQHYQSVSVPIGPDGRDSTCENANCEHLCSTRDDGSVQCSCRTGFDLAPDGRSCVDIDECQLLEGLSGTVDPRSQYRALLPALCDLTRQLCVNTEGGYGCRPLLAPALLRDQPPRKRGRGRVYRVRTMKKQQQHRERLRYQTVDDGQARQDSDECAAHGLSLCPELNTQCLNTEGAFSCVCSPGFYWSDGGNVCVDIDECLLLVDDCLESQRCLNTPGGYKCIRTQSCGTGYAMDSETEQCVDVDECTLGAHDCGPMYQCKNTQGSFRCVPKRCGAQEVLDPGTGECQSMHCPAGYLANEGRCEDVDECKAQPRRCAVYEECVNTPGSFRCQEQGNVCSNGYYMNKESGFCLDVDECQRDTHTCESAAKCINLPGSFRCTCDAGYEFSEYTMRCEDVDECVKFAGHACSPQADCLNTRGSYQCLCKPGFKLAPDNRSCDDIDECATGMARCQQRCINSPGSYQCICDRGYQLGIDELTCEDIDECAIWAKSGNELCMGHCVNVPGSFKCTCPPGYEILQDGITCKDIDECKSGTRCPGEQPLCINLLGGHRCQHIECPRNYLPDRHYKNRCVKRPGYCDNFALERCRGQPVHISWQHIAIPKQINISLHRTSVTLFSLKGPNDPNSTMQFELRLVDARADAVSVTPATRANFLLQKGDDRNSAVVALRDSLDGPQEVHLELVLRLSSGGQFAGKYLANLLVFVSRHRPQPAHSQSVHQRRRSLIDDGFSCLKDCRPTDALCLANYTREILFQFRALPTIGFSKLPVEVSRITTDLNGTLSVEYAVDGRNAQSFAVEQHQNAGVVWLTLPVRGPRAEQIRLHIRVKSRLGVPIAHNLALIEVHFSKYHF